MDLGEEQQVKHIFSLKQTGALHIGLDVQPMNQRKAKRARLALLLCSLASLRSQSQEAVKFPIPAATFLLHLNTSGNAQ